MSLIGQTVGKYEVIAELGRGGMGTVYKGRDPILDRSVAIKLLSPQLANDQSFIKRFQLEAQSVARLDHPNIVSVYDAGFYDGGWAGNIPYLVMEFVEGGGVDEMVRRTGSVPARRIVQIVEEVAAALDYAHARGFVHRDVKPANILLDANGHAHLTDFGLVKSAGNALTLTQGQIVGTPSYMAPEQIQGDEVSPQTDIYALGVVVYELLAGQVPFQGTMSAVFEAHIRHAPPSPRQLNPDLPPALEATILKALAKNPAERHESAGAFATALRGVLAELNGAAEQAPARTEIIEREATAPEIPGAGATEIISPGRGATEIIGAGATEIISPSDAPTGAGKSEPSGQEEKPGTPGGQVVRQSAPGGSPPKKGGLPKWLLGLGGAGALGLLALCACLFFLFQNNNGPGMVDIEPTPVPEVVVDGEATPEGEAPVTPESTPVTPEGGTSGAVASLEEVGRATIRIETQGTFVDPEIGLQSNVIGSGSGFIIDPSGLAVTNNHVVTGAGIIRVFLEGEAQPRTARVLGASECSDLAVIDIDGEGYSFLNWYDGEISSGQEIFAVGYPLGAPELSLTKGVVSKPQVTGETNWASVASVIEHDAAINPGSSGGPLVSPEGVVLGVNYASVNETSQNFAISREQALAIIEQLQAGNDVDSIGVNGLAVQSEELSGIWVASVKSGSAADKTGVKAGDIITELEGIALATDGTLSTYCSVLRSRNPEDVLDIQVLRFATMEVLSGQINGRSLATDFSFEEELEENEVVLEEESSEGNESSEEPTGYTDYTLVTDDAGLIQITVPVEWSEVNGSPWLFEGQEVGAAISAAGSLDAFLNSWTESGVFFAASRQLAQNRNEEALIDSFAESFSGSCEYGGREPYDDGIYTGFYDLWTNCGGEGTVNMVIAFVPSTRAYVGLVVIQITSEADLEALEEIILSFEVIGALQ